MDCNKTSQHNAPMNQQANTSLVNEPTSEQLTILANHCRATLVCWTLLLVVFFVFTAQLAAATDSLYVAVYKGTYSGWNITMERELTLLGENQFKLSSHSDNFFASITETSIFTIEEQNLKPIDYEISRSVFGKKKTESLNYDWDKNQATFKRSNKKRDTTKHEIEEGELDPALYQLQIQSDLFSKDEQPLKLEYTFAKRKKKNTYDFDIIGNSEIEIEGKAYKAIILERVDSKKKKTKIWVLPELDFQIGKLMHDNGKKTHEITLTSYKANKEKLYDFYRMMSPSEDQSET